MMRQSLDTLKVTTRGRGFYEVTHDVQAIVTRSGVQTGLCSLHLQHTSASLLVQENADPDVRRDFERFFGRLAPDGEAGYEHDYEGPDDLPAHFKASLLGCQLSVPVSAGRLAVGTWQGIYLGEHRNQGGSRRILATLHGED